MNAMDRAKASSSSVGKPAITSAWIADAGDRGPGSLDRPARTRRPCSGGPSGAARRRRPTGAAGGGAAACAARRRPRPPAARRPRAGPRWSSGGSARHRSRPGGAGPGPASVRALLRVRTAGSPLGPAAVVRADVDPGQHDLAVAGGERAADVGEDRRPGARLRSAPRARGMMQYVQWNEQPSCTLTKARVRSTEARSSAMPSMGLAASTPESVGQRRQSSGSWARASRRRRRRRPPSASSPSSSARNAAFVVVVHQARPRVDARVRPRVHLHRAAGHDDAGVGVRAAGAADRLAALLVGDRGHGARVDDDELRAAVRVHQRDAALAQQPGGRLHLGLVDLAAEVDDRGGVGARRGSR